MMLASSLNLWPQLRACLPGPGGPSASLCPAVLGGGQPLAHGHRAGGLGEKGGTLRTELGTFPRDRSLSGSGCDWRHPAPDDVEGSRRCPAPSLPASPAAVYIVAQTFPCNLIKFLKTNEEQKCTFLFSF